MEKLAGLKYKAVRDLPVKAEQEYGIIYVKVWRDEINTVHQCPCGCGNEVYLHHDLNRNRGWVINIKDEKITVKPSIGNTFKCRTHYFLTENKIRWC